MSLALEFNKGIYIGSTRFVELTETYFPKTGLGASCAAAAFGAAVGQSVETAATMFIISGMLSIAVTAATGLYSHAAKALSHKFNSVMGGELFPSGEYAVPLHKSLTSCVSHLGFCFSNYYLIYKGFSSMPIENIIPLIK